MSGNLYGGPARRSGKRVNGLGRGVMNFLCDTLGDISPSMR